MAVLTSLRSWQFLLCFSKQELYAREGSTEDDKENVGVGGEGMRQSPKNLDLSTAIGILVVGLGIFLY